MKAFYFAVAGFCFTITGYSQTNDTIVKIIPRGYEDKSPLLSPGSKLMAENKIGKVYSLRLDNMQCLVADLKNTIPIPTKKLYPCDSKMVKRIP